jgi:hypothetical protein
VRVADVWGFSERKIKYYALESTDVLNKLAGPEAAWYVSDFMVVDNPNGLCCRDRVLCVFTTGQAWQFKSYKWTDPRELFKHGMSPFHLRKCNEANEEDSARGVFPIEQ